MKIKKHIICAALLSSMMLLFTACGNTSSKGTPTLSEYASKDGAILYMDFMKLAKNSRPTICVFENGKVYVATEYDSNLGDLSKMTDDEIIAIVKAAVPEPYDFVWSVETDNTGNAADNEDLLYIIDGELKYAVKDVKPEAVGYTVYDAFYAGYYWTADFGIAARCKEGETPFVLDGPDNESEKVILDKTFTDIKQMFGVN